MAEIITVSAISIVCQSVIPRTRIYRKHLLRLNTYRILLYSRPATRNLSAFNCAALSTSIPRIVHSIYARYYGRVIDGSRSSVQLQLTKSLRSHRRQRFAHSSRGEWRLNPRMRNLLVINSRRREAS